MGILDDVKRKDARREKATAMLDTMISKHRKHGLGTAQKNPDFQFDAGVLNLDFAPNLKKLVHFISETGQKRQPALALAAVLALAGTLLGRKIQTQTGLRTNLYFCGLADSGYGKNHARKIIRDLLLGNEKTAPLLSMKLGTGAGIVALMAGFGQGSTPQPVKLFLHDEFGLFMQGISKENAPKYWRDVAEVLNDLFSEADGVYHSTATKIDGVMVIEEPNLSLYATSTPTELYQSLTATMLSSGLIARIIFVPGDKDSELRVDQPIAEIPDEIRNHISAVFDTPTSHKKMLGEEIIPTARVIPFSEDAKISWDQFRLKIDKRMRQSDDGYSSILNRAAEHAAKIALTVTGYELKNEIDLPTMQWAIRFVENAIGGLLEALNRNLAENIQEAQNKRILDLIRRIGGRVTKSEITRRTKFIDRRARDSILNDLIESGDLEMEKIDSVNTDKPTTIYFIPSA
jgi:hypothetical protein